MAQHSKYSDAQLSAIVNDMIAVLEKHKAPILRAKCKLYR